MNNETQKAVCDFDDCDGNGNSLPAVRRMPQSDNQGHAHTMANCCANRAAGWWDGADWNGAHLEARIGGES